MGLAEDICRSEAGRIAFTLALLSLPASPLFAGQTSPPPRAGSAGSFDPPIRQVTVDVAPSPRTHNARGELVCHYYPGLLVKEYTQELQKGARLSLLHTRGEPPACRPARESGERALEGGDFLMGVKDELVFVDAGETFNGALGFGVLDSGTGAQLFEDWVRYEETPAGSADLVRVFSTPAGYLLKYMSVAQAECDLNHDGRPCWDKVRAKLGLKSEAMPACTGYEHLEEMAQAFGTDYFESMVAYPVEVTLSTPPEVRTVAGPVACWPAF